MSPETIERKLAAILSADVVGYSRLMAEDEAATVRTISAYREQVEMLVRQERGRLVDFTGDNFLAEFPSAVFALRCALEIQRVIGARNADRLPERKMEFRMGIHLGDVRVEGDRLFGDGVNIAARLQNLAEPGAVSISGEVYTQVRSQLELEYEDMGEQKVKNIPDAVHVYRVAARSFRSTPDRTAGTRWRKLRLTLGSIAALIVVLGIGLWASWPRPLGLVIDLAGLSGPPVNPALPDIPSVVVLPFANMSGDPEQEYFSDGITEQITSDLARRPFLFVISRNSAFTYKGKAVKVEDVGRELGVRYVLEGSVRKAGNRVRIAAQLIDATTDHHVWSEQYDGDLADIFALQSKISEEITSALGPKIARAEHERARALPTGNLSAYEAMMRGLFYLNRSSRKDIIEARRWFERALEVDPDYAQAYALLGNTYSLEYLNGWNNLDPTSLDRGEELMRRALELNSLTADAHLGLAIVNFYRGRFPQAIAAAERAVELVPNFETYLAVLGVVLARDGQLVAAAQAINRAMRLNPRAPSAMYLSVAYVNYGVGRRREAQALGERMRLSLPDNILVRITLAATYEYDGRHEEARVAAQEALQVNPDLTAEIATRLIPGREQIFEPEEAAQFEANLRKAGLP